MACSQLVYGLFRTSKQLVHHLLVTFAYPVPSLLMNFQNMFMISWLCTWLNHGHNFSMFEYELYELCALGYVTRTHTLYKTVSGFLFR